MKREIPACITHMQLLKNMTKTVKTNCLKLAIQATAVDMQDPSYYRYTFLLLVLIQLAHVNTSVALKNRISALWEQTQIHHHPNELFASQNLTFVKPSC